MIPVPEVTVVLATRNRAASLDRLLASLSDQMNPPAFEVVVADNGSTDDTPRVIARAAERLALRSVRVEEPGKARALNAALQLAAGSLIVFTDDDVEPDPRWLAELYRAAATHPEMTIFGGRIEVGPNSVPGWVRRSYNLMGLLTSEHQSPQPVYGYGRYPFGPNMAVRRDALAGADAPYPEDMGPGTVLPVGDESGFFLRFSPPAARDRLYVPSAKVFHEVEPENVTFAEALRRSFLQGRAQRRLGISVVPDGDGAGPSFVRQVLGRIGACRSVRELVCVCVRHVGYMRESREA